MRFPVLAVLFTLLATVATAAPGVDDERACADASVWHDVSPDPDLLQWPLEIEIAEPIKLRGLRVISRARRCEAVGEYERAANFYEEGTRLLDGALPRARAEELLRHAEQVRSRTARGTHRSRVPSAESTHGRPVPPPSLDQGSELSRRRPREEAPALDAGADDPAALVARGDAHAARGDGDAAIRDYGRAIGLDPSLSAAYFKRGVALQKYQPNRPKAALDDFTRAVELAPRNALYWNRRGALLGETNQFAKAIADFDRALAIDPTLAAAFANRGLAKVWLNRLDEAAADFRQCLLYDPSLQRYLEQEQQRIPLVRQQNAAWLAWYQETIRSAVANRGDACADKYGETGTQVANCRSKGMNDTERRIQGGEL